MDDNKGSEAVGKLPSSSHAVRHLEEFLERHLGMLTGYLKKKFGSVWQLQLDQLLETLWQKSQRGQQLTPEFAVGVIKNLYLRWLKQRATAKAVAISLVSLESELAAPRTVDFEHAQNLLILGDHIYAALATLTPKERVIYEVYLQNFEDIPERNGKFKMLTDLVNEELVRRKDAITFDSMPLEIGTVSTVWQVASQRIKRFLRPVIRVLREDA